MNLSRCAWIAAAAVAAGRIFAADTPEAFAWQQPILGDIASGSVNRVIIPAEIFDGCKAFPADMRIIDERGVVWPFFLWSPPRLDDVTTVFAIAGKRSGGAGGQVVVQEVQVRPDEHGNPSRHNQVSILTAGHDFIRRVEVLGSDDGQSWKELGSGYLVDQMQEAHVSNRIVNYGESAATRLLLRIHPNARNEKEPIDVLDVQVLYRAANCAPLQQIALQPLVLSATEFRDGVKTLAYDTGAQNRPIERLRIRAAGNEFMLPVKVFGRNSAATMWRWAADGGLYRVGGQSRDVIDLHGAAYRQLKIEFYHYDQKPPVIDSVVAETAPQYLFFESQGGRSPMLHYGAEHTPLPRYDLQRRTRIAAITNAPVLELGKAKSNPLKVASGLASYIHTMIVIAVAIVFCAILYVLLRTIRPRLR